MEDGREMDPEMLCMGCMGQRTSMEGPCPFCGFDETAGERPLHHLPYRTILNGKYLIGKAIGEGGFGITYLGWDLNLDMKVAVKEYYPSGHVTRGNTSVTSYSGESAEFYEMGKTKFVSEAKTLAKFYSLPGIVGVKDFFNENNTAYIVMEYLDGITLKQYLEKCGGRMNPGQVLQWMRPVIRSLAEVHKAGLIHRDISPENIMITKENQVKLLDFGAARSVSVNGENSLSVMLKPGYAPEEQYRTHGEQGPWTDIYALCATIYRCMTGSIPPEPLERMRRDILLSPTQMGANLPPQQEAALLKGLSVYAGDRFQRVEDLEAALYGPAFVPRPNPAGGPGAPGRTVPVLEKNKTDAKPSGGGEKKPASPSGVPPAGGNSGVPPRYSPIPPEPEKKKGRKGIWIGAGAAVLVVVAVLAVWLGFFRSGGAKMGNTNGNISNLGMVAEADGRLYFSDPKGGIYSAKPDSSGGALKEVELISENRGRCLNIWDDRIYYIDLGNDFSAVRRMKLDGSKDERVKRVSALYLLVADGKIYFNDSASRLYSMDLDGSNMSQIGEEGTPYSYCNVEDGWIYAITGLYNSEDRDLVRINLKNDKAETLIEEDVDQFVLQDGWIYYITMNDRALCRVKADGTEKKTLKKNGVGSINVLDDWIYFRDGNSLCKIRTDGDFETKLTDQKGNPIYTAAGKIYYLIRNTGSDYYDLHQIMIDGKKEKMVLEGGQLAEETKEPETTEAPTTEAPTTEPPTTEAPTTEAPTTQAAGGGEASYSDLVYGGVEFAGMDSMLNRIQNNQIAHFTVGDKVTAECGLEYTVTAVEVFEADPTGRSGKCMTVTLDVFATSANPEDYPKVYMNDFVMAWYSGDDQLIFCLPAGYTWVYWDKTSDDLSEFPAYISEGAHELVLYIPIPADYEQWAVVGTNLNVDGTDAGNVYLIHPES